MSSHHSSGARDGGLGRVVYEVRAERDDGSIRGYGAVASRPVAEALMKSARERWDVQGSNRWWIEEIAPDAFWKVPPAPKPRDDRFGIVHLHTDGSDHGRDQIKCSSDDGERKVVFYTDSYHALDTGATMSATEFD